MQDYLKRGWPGWVIIGAMFFVAIREWPSAPASIPTHWNWAGEVDGHGGKFAGLLLMPIMAAGLWVLLSAAPLLKPDQFDRSTIRAFNFFSYVALGLIVEVFSVTMLWLHGTTVNMSSVILPSVLAMYAAIANLVWRGWQKRKRDANRGIRNPA